MSSSPVMREADHSRDAARAAGGDAEALQRLIVHYQRTLLGVVAGRIDARLRRHIDPHDVLQDAYVAVFKQTTLPQFEGPQHFYKWIEQIALNRLTDMQRSRRRQKRDVLREVHESQVQAASYDGLFERMATTESTPSRKVAREEAIAAVMTSLARLGDEQREVVRLRVFKDLPVAEIAERLGKTDVAVYGLFRRGLNSLRKYMGPISRYLTASGDRRA
ncbi:MAG: sigma-70 family RNA polymerase sigma factor [Planctomycetes bacterium]|nr:sigma-70 family RNA polymerase sigma factor [Planctomycetota bacterium]